MRSIILILILSLLSCSAKSQVRVRPNGAKGFEQNIATFVNNMKVVDTHEHLLSPEKLKQRTTLDFMLLLHHYSADDIKSAGLPSKQFSRLLKDTLTVMEKWSILEPYWERSKNTAYNRAALIAADKLFGINDINGSTVESLSDKIRNAYNGDWINQVMNEAGIEYLIQDNDDRTFGTQGFRYVSRFDNYININSRQQILQIAKRQNSAIVNLDDLIKALENSFNEAMKKGIVAVKTGLAYNRILNYENTSRGDALRVFENLMSSTEKNTHSFFEVKPLQDYMMHRVLDLAEKNKLPVMIHTGLQTGNGNIIENTKPTHLVNIIMEYPGVNFILMHGSYPYGPELTTIAKYFPNVYIDMCWMYVISPSYSERFLHEWLETVPASKIMGFGGDYLNIENAFSHLSMGRQVVTSVLTEKVRDGYFSEKEALKTASMILHDNAVRVFNLK